MHDAAPDPVRLVGRDRERAVLRELVGSLGAGRSRVLVVCGEAGVGKTALLASIDDLAADRRVLRVVGVESEMELAFAGVHQLCLPLLDGLDRLPAPQAAALRTVFGLQQGSAPDRFLVGLAVLGLLAEAASSQPLLCIIDGAEWLDHASALVLAFVGRRLDAEPVGLLFAVREPLPALQKFTQLRVEPLDLRDARALLDLVVPETIDRRVREQILAETRGNPLQLVELPREIRRSGLAGGFALADAFALPADAETMFRRRIEELPEPERRFLVLAAADPTGDAPLLRRAAESLGLPGGAGTAAQAGGLMEFGARPRFRHPLVRTAAYRFASPGQRREAHRALSDATDATVDPDRRAWHRALATDETDETVATELETAAERAELRGGLSAAAAFLERAALLTSDPLERARRAVAAAQTKRRAGEPDSARDLLSLAAAGPMREADRARAALIEAQLDVGDSWGGAMPQRLLAVADRLAPVNGPLARMVHLEAVYAAAIAGRLAVTNGDLPSTVAAALERISPGVEEPAADAHPVDSLRLLLDRVPNPAIFPDRGLRWWSLTAVVALSRWDLAGWSKAAGRHLELCRQLGAVTDLPLALSMRVFVAVASGGLREADIEFEELRAVSTATGNPSAPSDHAAMALAAVRGDGAALNGLLARGVPEAQQRGEGVGVAIAHWARALLENGRGRYAVAATAAVEAARSPLDLFIRNAALAEAVEALVRSDQAAEADAVFRRLAESIGDDGPDWGRGILARAGALTGPDDEADLLYREAVDRFARAGARADLARAHLLHGEWLRRMRRRAEARNALRTAREQFDGIGMNAFAERAARELWATGENGSRPGREPDALTSQEGQIARLASEGLTNPEIAGRLFISARTVEYHLGKVFSKLGITSRTQLDGALK